MPLVNDLDGNPWTLAEVGLATEQKVYVDSFTYCEPDLDTHCVVIEDSSSRPVITMGNGSPTTVLFQGWVDGMTVCKLDSGYVVASLRGK